MGKGRGRRNRKSTKSFKPTVITTADQPSGSPAVVDNAKEHGSGKDGTPAETSIAAKEVQALTFGVKLLAHLVAILFLVGVGFGTHFILKDLFGDPRAFDLIPIRYAIEVGDLAIIVSLAVRFIRDLLKDRE